MKIKFNYKNNIIKKKYSTNKQIKLELYIASFGDNLNNLTEKENKYVNNKMIEILKNNMKKKYLKIIYKTNNKNAKQIKLFGNTVNFILKSI